MAKGKKNSKSVELNLQELAGDAGLVLLRDSEYALIKDRLPLFLPRIDRIFGGGLPFGRMIECAGKPGGGKSTLAFHAARVGSQLGCIVVLIDVEGTADHERLSHLGIDVSKVLVKQPDPDKGIDLTVEEIGRTIEQTLEVFKKAHPDLPVIYIWDSIGQTPSETELGKDYGEQNVGARAKAITQFVTKISPRISQTKSMLFAINQVRDDIGGNPMFQTYNVPGGKAWEHAASLRIEIKKKQAIKKGSGANSENLGHIMGVKTQKSKVSRPFQEVNAFLISDNGLDYEYNLVHMAVEDGIVDTVGQSFTYTDNAGNVHKMVRANFVEWLRTAEGQPIRQEILNKLILKEFPDGDYPALKNETLDISGWVDKIDLNPIVEATDLVPLTEIGTEAADNLISEIQNEINGDLG